MIYFLRRASGEGPIKIGCSGAPEWRRRQLSSDFKTPMQILATAPGGFRDEGRLHRELADHAASREWFEATDAVLAVVEHVQQTGHLPPPASEDRDDAFVRRYLGGETLRQIAGDFGLSAERVRQVLKANGVRAPGKRAA